jgi:hypothetical protein
LVSVALSFVTPQYATLAYLLNLVPPLRQRFRGK